MSNGKLAILITALCVVFFSAVMLAKQVIEYKSAEDEYNELAAYTSVASGDTTSFNNDDGEALEADKENKNSGLKIKKADEIEPEEEEDKILKRNYNRSDFPDIDVDFDGLKKINSDVVAWVYVGATGISYPVVKGVDNEYYLHNTFENKKNASGCIFMDWEVDENLTSWNTFIYGHNMKNGTMFGTLKYFVWNSNTYDKDHYIFVFRPDAIYRYEIFSYYLDSTDSKMYYTCDSFSEYQTYLREATKKSAKECEAKASDEDNIVTLVTCSGKGSSKQRFFVHATFKDRYVY